MKTIRKNVGQVAEVLDVTVDYAFMSRTVGGDIQMIPLGPGVDVVCHEEGMYAGPGGRPLPFNAAGYLGNILIVGMDDDGDERGLTDEEVRRGLAYLERYKDLKHNLSGEVEILVGMDQINKHLFGAAISRESIWETL